MKKFASVGGVFIGEDTLRDIEMNIKTLKTDGIFSQQDLIHVLEYRYAKGEHESVSLRRAADRLLQRWVRARKVYFDREGTGCWKWLPGA
jgi:hypothetical protein